MRTETPQPVRLKDYQAPDFLIDETRLDFCLDPERSRVRSKIKVRRNGAHDAPLKLDGEAIGFISAAIDGRTLAAADYEVGETSLTIPNVPDAFTLEIENEFSPKTNTALSGIYISGERFFSQCEAEGFRRITYFLDRPDVLSTFSVRIEASTDYPTLLSNGNMTGSGQLEGGRHWVEWNDPFPKPCYLFALVGGTFDCLEGDFTTVSGRNIPLRLYVDKGDAPRAAYALDALKRSMAWDEKAFGREYDLDLFMIVAVRDFNFGAMENKGLNIFNSALLLADPQTATDFDYEAIESVVAHEYFHNWTGNRITCRDWFQLCLKEGLTVFRDQEFSAHERGAGLARIKDVRQLRMRQFPEDAGPLAHPVRPASYMKIDNFYTATVYEKGAEIIRMLREMIGEDDFRVGMDRYFDTLDGTAATVEQFVDCFAQATGRDLSRWMDWYNQAGTPHIRAKTEYDAASKTATVTIAQTTPPTPGQDEKVPLTIPVRLGLIDPDGAAVPLRLEGENVADAPLERTVVLTEAEENFRFIDVPAPPVASLFRNFSAPIVLDTPPDAVALAHIAKTDADTFNRWEAGQTTLRTALVAAAKGGAAELSEAVIDVLRAALVDETIDPGLAAQMLAVPDEVELAQHLLPFDPDAARTARRMVRKAAATALKSELEATYARMAPEADYSPNGPTANRRALRNACLGLLAELGPDVGGAMADTQLAAANNLTDRLAALAALDLSGSDRYDAAVAELYEVWRKDPLTLDKWFAAQSRTSRPDALSRVEALLGHPDYDGRTPNRVRAVLGVFAVMNPVAFHDVAGEGHKLFADQVENVDKLNPALAARLLGALEIWPRLEPKRRASAKAVLERFVNADQVSKNVMEIASRALAAEVPD
ncbi:MAG: aminopeptidase N [Maricaulaceae bacterium]|jgi:aminopeptidase N